MHAVRPSGTSRGARCRVPATDSITKTATPCACAPAVPHAECSGVRISATLQPEGMRAQPHAPPPRDPPVDLAGPPVHCHPRAPTFNKVRSQKGVRLIPLLRDTRADANANARYLVCPKPLATRNSGPGRTVGRANGPRAAAHAYGGYVGLSACRQCDRELTPRRGPPKIRAMAHSKIALGMG